MSLYFCCQGITPKYQATQRIYCPPCSHQPVSQQIRVSFFSAQGKDISDACNLSRVMWQPWGRWEKMNWKTYLKPWRSDTRFARSENIQKLPIQEKYYSSCWWAIPCTDLTSGSNEGTSKNGNHVYIKRAMIIPPLNHKYFIICYIKKKKKSFGEKNFLFLHLCNTITFQVKL